jgi:hypothetical protein
MIQVAPPSTPRFRRPFGVAEPPLVLDIPCIGSDGGASRTPLPTRAFVEGNGFRHEAGMTQICTDRAAYAPRLSHSFDYSR